MSQPPLTVTPGFTPTETSALIAALGSAEVPYTLRGFAQLGPWLDARSGGDAGRVVDELRDRMQTAHARGDAGTLAFALTSEDFDICRAALSHALSVTRNDALFVARYGINRQRALHLRSALRLEHAVGLALESATASTRDAVGPMLDAAREMRRWRLDRYDGLAPLAESPELNLMADALSVAAGRSSFGVLRGSVDAAWDGFTRDRQAASATVVLDR